MCGRLIGNINTSDYYSFIRRKYCMKCAEEKNRENARQRCERIRRESREKNKLLRQQNEQYKEENRLQRKLIEALREELRYYEEKKT